MPKPKVAHISTTYLKESETFIYSFVNNHKSFDPFVVTEEYINKKIFPAKVFEVSNTNPQGKVLNLIYRELFFRKKGIEKNYLEILNKEKPAVLVCHFGPTGLFSLPLARSLNVPLITSFYGYDLSYERLVEVVGKTGGRHSLPVIPSKGYWERALRYLFRNGDLFLAPTEGSAQRLIEMGAPREKVRVLNLGVDLNFLKKFRKVSSKKSSKIVTVASLERGRGLEYALEAISTLLKSFHNLEYHIYGRGSQEQALHNKVEELGLGKKVSFITENPASAFLNNVSDYQVFLNPVEIGNLGSMEGWINYSMMQTMSLGVVPVATHVVGAELIAPGETGYFINQKDPGDIVEKIRLLYENKKMLDVMSKNAEERISLYFNAAKQTEKLEKVFDDAIASLL